MLVHFAAMTAPVVFTANCWCTSQQRLHPLCLQPTVGALRIKDCICCVYSRCVAVHFAAKTAYVVFTTNCWCTSQQRLYPLCLQPTVGALRSKDCTRCIYSQLLVHFAANTAPVVFTANCWRTLQQRLLLV